MGLPYRKGEVAMTRLTTYPTHDDVYEYFGGTTIQWTRRKADETVWQDWLLFDSIEAALEFFNEFCSA
jgi:triphosphoribosyl-dephospho-CoA synthetase